MDQKDFEHKKCEKEGHEQNDIESICLDSQCAYDRLLCHDCVYDHNTHFKTPISCSPKKKSSLLKFSQHENKQDIKKNVLKLLERILYFPQLIIRRIKQFESKIYEGYLFELKETISNCFDSTTTQKITQKLLNKSTSKQKVQEIYKNLKIMDLPQISDLSMLENCLACTVKKTQPFIEEQSNNLLQALSNIQSLILEWNLFEKENWGQALSEMNSNVVPSPKLKRRKTLVEQQQKDNQNSMFEKIMANINKWNCIDDWIKKGNKVAKIPQLNFEKKSIQFQEICLLVGNGHLWSEVKQINLSGNKLGPQSIQILIGNTWSNVNILNLSNNSIKADGVKSLIKNDWLKLNDLNLENNQLQAEGVKYLVKHSWLKLGILNIGRNKIGLDGIKHLITHDWPKLNDLNLNFNQIGSLGIKLIVGRNWKKLKQLWLKSNNFSNEEIKMLKQKFENVDVFL